MAIPFVFQLVIIALYFGFMVPCESSTEGQAIPLNHGQESADNDVELKDFDISLAKVLSENLSRERCTQLYIFLAFNKDKSLGGNGTRELVRKWGISRKLLVRLSQGRTVTEKRCFEKLAHWSAYVRERNNIRAISQLKPLLARGLNLVERSDLMDNVTSTMTHLKHVELEKARAEIESHSRNRRISKTDTRNGGDGDREEFILERLIVIMTIVTIVLLATLKCILSATNYDSKFIKSRKTRSTTEIEIST